jgi:hypothetical protein
MDITQVPLVTMESWTSRNASGIQDRQLASRITDSLVEWQVDLIIMRPT